MNFRNIKRRKHQDRLYYKKGSTNSDPFSFGSIGNAREELKTLNFTQGQKKQEPNGVNWLRLIYCFIFKPRTPNNNFV